MDDGNGNKFSSPTKQMYAGGPPSAPFDVIAPTPASTSSMRISWTAPVYSGGFQDLDYLISVIDNEQIVQ